MNIVNILNELEEAKKQKEKLTRHILEENINLARYNAEYKKELMKYLIKLRNDKTPTAIINKIAEGQLSDSMMDIEITIAKVKALKDKLENTRQDIEVLRSLLRNERELSQL